MASIHVEDIFFGHNPTNEKLQYLQRSENLQKKMKNDVLKHVIKTHNCPKPLQVMGHANNGHNVCLCHTKQHDN
jgi:hypothetical protein